MDSGKNKAENHPIMRKPLAPTQNYASQDFNIPLSTKSMSKSDTSNLQTSLSDLRITSSEDSGIYETGITIHRTFVEPGEDIVEKLKAFASTVPRNRYVCILSACGHVSDPTLFITVTGGTVTYEGEFEIISIRGVVYGSQSNEISYAISVALSGECGLVLGGAVVNLIAVSPIEILLGSFVSQPGKDISNVGTDSSIIRWEETVIPRMNIDSTMEKQQQLDVLEEGGSEEGFDSFKPYVILVQPGEDVIKMVKTFVLNEQKTVSVMSAHGLLSNVTLLGDDFHTYEGKFQLISMRGTVTPSRCNSSLIMVSLVDSNGHVLGGVGINLIAEQTMQVILGSFVSPPEQDFA